VTAAAATTMNPAYFETRFRLHGPEPDWPAEFAILSAWATTGETWPRARSEAADAALETELHARTGTVIRVTGCSPTTGHSEPSWAAPLPFDEACDVGLRYLQDAIYWVERGTLYVSPADTTRERVEVGSFGSRVTRAAGT
jgi:hypothetical protein